MVSFSPSEVPKSKPGYSRPLAPEATVLSVQLGVGGEGPASAQHFLRGALALRLLERGHCITTRRGDVRVDVDVGTEGIRVDVGPANGGWTHAPRSLYVEGVGNLSALEAIHRAASGVESLGAAGATDAARACARDAIGVHVDDRRGVPSALTRDWVSALVASGRSLAADAEPQVCLGVEDRDLVLGVGTTCEPVVRIPPSRIGDHQLERAVGATLALGGEPTPPVVVRPVVRVDEAGPATRDEDETVDVVAGPPPRPTPPVVAPQRRRASRSPTFDATVAGGVALRRGGIDPAADIRAGLRLSTPVILAAGATLFVSRLKQRVVAFDGDILASLGFVFWGDARSGGRVDAAAGGRLHRYRRGTAAGAWGRATWVGALGVSGWWTIRSRVGLSVGLSQRLSGHAWLHDVNLYTAGSRGRWMTLLTMGAAWLGRAR
ncbi:MAG: hypothetical protein B7733_01305 [Myxococcales bacterium FL481]|nr:MAG: hypothetical protein B7733_01305 [Myxococcales bacterium FL481]